MRISATLVEEGNLSGDGSVFQNLVSSKTFQNQILLTP